MITAEDRAAELYTMVRGCALCALSTTRTHAVPGEGPLDAEVMCIGEAPGVNEDRQGRPFVGAAGQFLGELLAAAGLTREQVYICNVLKCRPPGNRDPLPSEIEACSEYLDVQIDMVDPRVIITLGRFSMSKWFPQQAISRIHGSVKEADGRLIVPMYHPAAALHQGNLRQVLLDDFARVPAILERARGLSPSLALGPEPAIRAASGKERWDVESPEMPGADTLTPRPPLPSLGEGEERPLTDRAPAPVMEAAAGPATGAERGHAEMPGVDTFTPRPDTRREVAAKEAPGGVAVAGTVPAETTAPVVSGAKSAMMDGSEQAAASPHPGFGAEEAAPSDVAPAESPDSSAAGKTEQIRLFD